MAFHQTDNMLQTYEKRQLHIPPYKTTSILLKVNWNYINMVKMKSKDIQVHELCSTKVQKDIFLATLM